LIRRHFLAFITSLLFARFRALKRSKDGLSRRGRIASVNRAWAMVRITRELAERAYLSAHIR